MSGYAGLILFIPTLVEETFGLSVTTFTQSFGETVIVNGGFDGWVDGHLDAWVTSGESGGDPRVSQVAPDGSPGTGAARFYSSATPYEPTIFQVVLVVGSWYEARATVVVTAGTAYLRDAADGGVILTGESGTYTIVWRSRHTFYLISPPNAAPSDFVMVEVEIVEITPNAVYEMDASDGEHTLYFALPDITSSGQRIELRYKQKSDDDGSYWAGVISRSATNDAWDARLVSVNAGTQTIRSSATNVGAVDAIRITTDGNSHILETGVGGAFTPRGSEVVNSFLSAEIGITAFYSEGFVAMRLTSVGA